MNFSNKSKFIFGLLLVLLVLGIPVTTYVVQHQQESRSRASASTTLSLIPSAPVNAKVGDTVSFDVMLNPGSNLVTFVKLQISYDPTVLELSQPDPFILNTVAFPVKLEGPYLTSGSLIESISIGNDPTKVIKELTKIGTINFKAIKSTNNTASKVLFGTSNLVLSSAAEDQSSENVLSTTIPSAVIISDVLPTPTTATPITPSPTQSPTLMPTATPTPKPTSTPTPIPTSTPTPKPTLTPTSIPTPAPTVIGNTQLNLTILLHGIGSSGDNVTTESSFSNKNPLHTDRTSSISLYNTNNQLVAAGDGNAHYSNASGAFEGIINIASNLPTDTYVIKIRSGYHLTRRIDQIVSIVTGQNNDIPAVNLIAGDINNDNKLNIFDYNILIDCYSDYNPAAACSDTDKQVSADINDDGLINGLDYNLFLRELANQQGD